VAIPSNDGFVRMVSNIKRRAAKAIGEAFEAVAQSGWLSVVEGSHPVLLQSIA